MKRQKGFTIIEVLIVLAIASLIMLIVFLAVPALQRSSRNLKRKQDVARIIALVEENKAYTGTRLPASCNNTHNYCFLRKIELGHYDNKSTTDNNVSFWNRTGLGAFDDSLDVQLDPSIATDFNRVAIRTYTRCSGGLLTGVNATSEDYAAEFLIETFSSGDVTCIGPHND